MDGVGEVRQLADRLAAERAVRPEEVARARAALAARGQDHPTDAIAATLIQSLVSRRLP